VFSCVATIEDHSDHDGLRTTICIWNSTQLEDRTADHNTGSFAISIQLRTTDLK